MSFGESAMTFVSWIKTRLDALDWSGVAVTLLNFPVKIHMSDYYDSKVPLNIAKDARALRYRRRLLNPSTVNLAFV